MNWYDLMEKHFFIDDCSKHLIDFLTKNKYVTGQCDPEKWKSLFSGIKQWEQRYLISSEVITIGGIDGWDVCLTFGEFSLPDDMEQTVEEYMSVILLTGWTLSFENDEDEYKCCINGDMEERFHIEFDYPKEQCAGLSKKDFLSELQGIYNRSYENFQLYRQDKNSNPKLIAQWSKQYPKYLDHIQFFENHLDDCSIIRLNTFKLDENLWYLVKSDSVVYFILIQEFM